MSYEILREGREVHAAGECEGELPLAEDCPVGTVARCVCGRRWIVRKVLMTSMKRERAWRRKWL